MICFVTWPPFSQLNYYKGGQVTKPIILVKICYNIVSRVHNIIEEYELLIVYVIHGVKYFDKVTSWPQLISKFFGHTCLFAMLLLIGLAHFYTPGVFV